MKSFKININENGDFNFVDKNDERVLKTLFSSLYKKGIKKLNLSFSNIESNITDKQISLFEVLVSTIKKETGQDEKSIEECLVKNYNKNKSFVSEIPKEDFTDFLESCFHFTQEFFSINININNDGKLQIYH